MVTNCGVAGRDYIGVSVGALIIDEKQRVLLLKRKKTPESGCWSIPGGMVEYNEKIESALIREVREELGVNIKIIKFLCVIDNLIEVDLFHTISLSYIVDIIDGELRNMEKEKHSEIKWFELNGLPMNLTVPTRATLIEYEKHKKGL